MDWDIAIAWGLGLGMASLVIGIHNEALRLVSLWLMPRIDIKRRQHFGLAMLVLLFVHLFEVQVFGLGFYLAMEYFDLGDISGKTDHSFREIQYFSIVSYTSLGLGDLYPVGHMRLFTGIEALTGLLMIGWTASFIFAELAAHRPNRIKD